jgi:hypothetical protein
MSKACPVLQQKNAKNAYILIKIDDLEVFNDVAKARPGKTKL